VKRDVDTVLTYPAVMGSVFVAGPSGGSFSRPRGRGGLRRVACVVVVLAVLKNRDLGANTSPAAYCVSEAKGAPISPSRMD
jgi:hypothetical protein